MTKMPNPEQIAAFNAGVEAVCKAMEDGVTALRASSVNPVVRHMCADVMEAFASDARTLMLDPDSGAPANA